MPKTAATVSDGGLGEIYVKDGNRIITGMPTGQANTVRKALNKWHREKKAEKPPKRHYAAWFDDPSGTKLWVVRDSALDHELHATFPHRDCAEADAKAFAKLLNREDRKRNTVTPGFKEI